MSKCIIIVNGNKTIVNKQFEKYFNLSDTFLKIFGLISKGS